MHYELLVESNDDRKICPDTSPRFKYSMIKPRTSFKNFGRPKRSTDDPVKISTTYDIVGHSEKPFQQRKTFYPMQNYTDIIVEAHNVSSVLLQFFSLSSGDF